MPPYCSSSNVDSSNDDEERSTNEDIIYIVDHSASTLDHLMAQTEFMEDAGSTSRTSLLHANETRTSINLTDGGSGAIKSKAKQSKEAKKYLRKLDSNLESLKTQNNELLSVIKNSGVVEQLVPIQTCSYLVETRYNEKLSAKGLFSMNARDTIILACIVVVVVPLMFIVYRYIYIAEHTGLDIKP